MPVAVALLRLVGMVRQGDKLMQAICPEQADRPAARRRCSCRIAARVLAAGLACLDAGCSNDTGDGGQPTGTAPGLVVGGPQQTPASCQGADLSGLKSTIYVSTQGANGPGCGMAPAAACATIQQGILRCGAASGCGVLVRHGRYQITSTIVLKDGVGVYGGCTFDGTPPNKYRTVVEADPAPGTPAVSGTAIDSATAFHGLVVIGKDVTANGTASIAMALVNSKGLVLSGTVLASGKGGDGAPGSTPPATSGNTGGDAVLSFGTDTWSGTGGTGAPACTIQGQSAGAGGAGANFNQINSHGCFFTCGCDNVGGTGGAQGAPGGGGETGGGGGGVGANGPICSPGGTPTNGGTGNPGAPGACSRTPGVPDANAWGTFTNAVWQPGGGGSGGLGNWGAGGGGGGAGSACTHTNGTAADFFGFPGGGGGSGGCGGPGGAGGQQGGASVGLVLVASSLATGSGGYAIFPGPGGQGGPGGPGNAGGAGGPGGRDGKAVYYPDIATCSVGVGGGNEGGLGYAGGPGGPGGQGGAGGGGGGGNGGPSIGVATRAASGAPDPAGIYVPAQLAAGGPGGAPGSNASCTSVRGSDGLPGGGMPVLDADLPLASILFAGQQLGIGQSIRSPDGGHFLVAQGDGNLVLYNSAGGAAWATNTGGNTAQRAVMRGDGDFVWVDVGQFNLWESGTSGHPGAYLSVRDDGHIAIVAPGGSTIWSAP